MDLLALKQRTKLIQLANFTSLHIFVVSLRCEHSCPYCQVSRQSDDKLAFDMSQETADKALAAVFESPSSAIKIEFQGGDPWPPPKSKVLADTGALRRYSGPASCSSRRR